MSEVAATATQSAPSTTLNTPVEGAEPVVISGGDSPASWDELDALTVKGKQKAEPKEVKEPKEKKEAKEPKETKEAKAEDDGDKQTKDAKAEKKDSAEVAKSDAPVKLLKLKSGDKTLDVSADTLVPVKIDGKTVEVSLQEAINRYSQQSHVDKLYKSYKAEKDSFEKEKTAISEALNKSYDYLVNQKDLRGFLEYLGEAMGVDSETLYNDAVGNLSKQIEEFSSLSPEERKLKELEAENARYRQKADAEKQQKLQAKSKAELESHVSKVMEDYGMDQAALVKSWDDLTSLGHKPEEITPEFLGAYYANTQTINAIEQKLTAINPELAQNGKIIEELATHAIQTELNDAEIEEVISQLYGETPEKKLSKKIDKNTKANRQGGSKAQKNPGSDPLFFDDI